MIRINSQPLASPSRFGRLMVILVFLSLIGGCARYENVPPVEAASRPQDKVVAYELKQIISGVTLSSGERQDFDPSGAVYDYVRKLIIGITTDGAEVEIPIAEISSIEFRVPGDTLYPTRSLPFKDTKASSTFWITDTAAGTALPASISVKVKGRTGTVDTLRHIVTAVLKSQKQVDAPFDAVKFVRLRVPPSITSPKGIGLMGWVNTSLLSANAGQLAVQQEWRSGFDLGTMVNVRLNKRLCLQTEVSWSINRATVYQSGTADDAQVIVADRMRLSLFEFTLLGKYSILRKSRSDWFLVAGPSISFAKTARSQFDSTYSRAGFVLGDSGTKNLVNIRKPFVGAKVGIELTRRIGRWRPTVGLRYSFGFGSIFESGKDYEIDDSNLAVNERNSLPLNLSTLSFSIGFTVPF